MELSAQRPPFTRSFLRIFLLLAAFIVSSLSYQPALAQSCGEEYLITSGESLSRIAGRVYGDTQKWSLIYNANLKVIGENPNLILIGQSIRIPCLAEKAAIEPAATSTADSASADSESNNTENTAPEDASEETNSPSDTVDAESAETTTKSTTSDGETTAQKSESTDEADADTETSSTANTGDAIRLLTGGDYAPFTDQNLEKGGMITDMVVSAFENNPIKPAYQLDWNDDWSVHLDPLLTTHEYDMGFPWFQPDCKATPDEFRCQNFNFSNPVFQILGLLFTHKERPLVFETDEDIAGAVLCRPAGYYTHDLEKDGRKWVTNEVITLKQPATIKECFDMLVAGTIDAVALNEFTGRSAVSKLSLKDQVVALEGRPLSFESVHVVVHKDHPRAQELLDTLNDSLTELQLSSAYNDILDTHFRNFWSTID